MVCGDGGERLCEGCALFWRFVLGQCGVCGGVRGKGGKRGGERVVERDKEGAWGCLGVVGGMRKPRM